MPRGGGRSRSGGFGGRSRGPPPAQQKKQTQPAQRQQSPAPQAYAPQQRGGGFLQNVATIGAGVAVGHVAGRALENLFFGGTSHQASPEEMEQIETKVKSGPCGIQYEGFNRCINRNEEDVAKCEWAFDIFKDCQLDNKNKAALGVPDYTVDESSSEIMRDRY
eukprot:TRINITY_DN600_c0_g1_i2.p1 TRINITY_DN600_c0_g1~~TRINITY_DN600_c0_g1_i2.p1  ORF type:complete len:163 (-),score=51.78 TRINITY_DN600_c0_g1_i2:59-547(-)